MKVDVDSHKQSQGRPRNAAEADGPATCHRAVPCASRSTPSSWELNLTVTPQVLTEVRTLLETHLRLWGRSEACFVATLGATELLTNVLVHTEDPVVLLRVQCVSDGVTVTVIDGDNRLPTPEMPDLLSDQGRGLMLVKELSASMGVTASAQGKGMWFHAQATTEQTLDESCDFLPA